MSAYKNNQDIPSRTPSPTRDEPSASGDQKGKGPVTRQDNAGVVLKGRGPRTADKRKFKYDVLTGRSANLPFGVTRDDRMSAQEAGEALVKLQDIFGLHGESHANLHAFSRALFFCHTVNSGSTLLPGRSTFSIPGFAPFNYDIVRNTLGINMRRFFRAFADDITDVNREVIDGYNPDNPESEEKWGWLMQVASDRVLERYPYLAHDSADACLRLSPPERRALNASKAQAIGATPNSADRYKPSKISSMDRYDSTTGETF